LRIEDYALIGDCHKPAKQRAEKKAA